MDHKCTLYTANSMRSEEEKKVVQRQNQLKRYENEILKYKDEFSWADKEVKKYEYSLRKIQSFHKIRKPELKWHEIAYLAIPPEPNNERTRETQAELKLENYSPNFIDRLFKLESKKREKLHLSIKNSIKIDLKEFQEAHDSWVKKVKDTQEKVRIAKGILENDPQSKIDAIKTFSSFYKTEGLGTELQFYINENNRLCADLDVYEMDIIPKQKKKLLKSGKLSTRDIAKSTVNEIYQDYVCSSIIHIANDVFSIVPENMVKVTARSNILNKMTGYKEKLPIVSVIFTKETLQKINIFKIDPSDSLKNFAHNMDFKKARGFETIKVISYDIFQ